MARAVRNSTHAVVLRSLIVGAVLVSTFVSVQVAMAQSSVPISGGEFLTGSQHVTAGDRNPRPLPLDAIHGPYRERTLEIIAKPQIRRYSTVEAFSCDPKTYQWILDHPVWVSRLWTEMGIPVEPIVELPDGFQCQEDRSTAEFHQVYDSAEMRIFYCWGEFKKTGLPGRVTAEMVLVHRYRFVRRPDGGYVVVQYVEGFVSARSRVIKAVLKVTGMTSDRLVDQFLGDIMLYFSLMARMIPVRPHRFEEAIVRMERQTPPTQLAELHELRDLIAKNKPLPPPILPTAHQVPVRER